jgi:uncharacterized protein (DUF2147 family)
MLLTLIGLAIAAPSPQSADAAIGRWRTETRGGIVEIQRCGASICGRVLTSDMLRSNPGLKDAKNANAALRNRPLRGLQILSGFTRSGGGWTGGKIYNADDGKTYGSDVTPSGANQLNVRGCVFKPFCKTQTWTRIR